MRIELHTLVCEIVDADGLTYDQALARARQELRSVQQYARDWDHGAAYLEVLAVLNRGEQPTAALLDALLQKDQVVRYVLLHVR